MAPQRLPYPGLRAFTRDESDLFFGRDGCVDAMVDRLAATRFLAVLGASGSGKSSLVRTGLLDALDLGLHPSAGSRWKVADLHPGGQPIRNLAAALLLARDGAQPDAADTDLLAAFLRRGPRSLAEWVSGGNVASDTNLLILVDQFEELFRYGNYARQEEAEAFVTLLIETASVAGVRIHIVVTMRSEFLGACALMPGLAEKINAGLYLTPRMTRDECQEAIEGPAGVTGFKVERPLVNRLLNDLASFAPWESADAVDQAERLARRADQLPLMQHVLNRIWSHGCCESRPEGVVLRLADYDGLGGLSGALDAHGEEILAQLGASRLPGVESVFRSLVSGSSVALAVRRPCRLGDLIEAAGNRDDVLAIVEAFRAPDCNFLRTSEESLADDDVIVDISHESLIRQWAPLRAWLENEAQASAAWQRLVAAQERHDRREGGLLSGLDLQNLAAWWKSAAPAAAWAKRHGGSYQAVQSYLAESQRVEDAREAAERASLLRKRNRLLATVAGLAIALACFVGLAISDYRTKRKLVASTDSLQASTTNLKETIGKLDEKSKVAAAALSEAEKQRREAEMQREEADRQRVQAEEEARRTAGVLDGVSNVVYSDRYKSLVGVGELQSDLMKTLLRYQADLSKRHANMVERASVARDDFRLGRSFETIGDARQALSSYAKAYEEGRDAIAKLPRGQPLPESLLVNFMEDGYRYVWFLLDIGETEQGDRVLQGVKYLVDPHAGQATKARELIAYSQLENLESRYYADQKMKDLQHSHSSKAVELAIRALALSDADFDSQYFAFTAVRNHYLTVSGAGDASPEVARECKMADQMIAERPLDLRSIRSRIDCGRDQTFELVRQQKFEDAVEKLRSAEEVAFAGLRAAPHDQTLLLEMADLENALGDRSYGKGQEKILFDHRMAAKKYLTQALNGRTLFQNSSSQVKDIYDRCKLVVFPNSQAEISFYQDIAEAVAATLDAFPKAPSFAYVAADASSNAGKVLAGDAKRIKDEQRFQEAETYLTRAIGWYDKSGAMLDLSVFSESFAAYCGAYYQRAELFSLTGRLDRMLDDLKKMKDVCTPAMNKYPWDFYLRVHFLDSPYLAGKVLVNAQRYAEALPYIEEASHWGVEDSTRLLARLYREGLGVAKSEDKAKKLDELAKGQTEKHFKISADFGGFSSPFIVYAREWPPEYPFEGIEDQVTWLKEARGGTVAADDVEKFHKLQRIARENGVSFPELCGYALADENKPAANDASGQK